MRYCPYCERMVEPLKPSRIRLICNSVVIIICSLGLVGFLDLRVLYLGILLAAVRIIYGLVKSGKCPICNAKLSGKVSKPHTRNKALLERDSTSLRKELISTPKTKESKFTFCYGCGTMLTEEVIYCSNCGTERLLK